MMLAPTINQHVLNLPRHQQAEILDFVLFLEQRKTVVATVESVETQSQPVATLFAALDQARNTSPIGRLHREELYE